MKLPSLILTVLVAGTVLSELPAASAEEGASVTAAQATDAASLALSHAFKATASALRDFDTGKEHFFRNRRLLISELKNIALALEPTYDAWGSQIGAEQETAALEALRSDAELAPYAGKVQKLWKETLKIRPLNVRFIAKTVDPAALAALDEADEEETEAETNNTPLVLTVILAALLGIAGGIAFGLYSKKRRAEEERQAEEEAAERARRALEEAKRKEEQSKPVIEQIEESNTYDVTDLVMSDDMGDEVRHLLHKPERRILDTKYTLVVYLNDKMQQRIEMTKPVLSFGRRGATSEARTDISLDLADDKSISRFHGILNYVTGEDLEGKKYGFWMLALMQKSVLTAQPDTAPPASPLATKVLANGQREQGRALNIEKGEKVLLSNSVSIVIE